MTQQANSGPWLSPAKLNLFLYITGQRDNGYHDLQTLFQFIDCCDQLFFTPTQSGSIELNSQLDFPVEDNLVVKAARLLQQYSHIQQGVSITLDKHLPMGGGIGGGSSNAATTLLVLNHLWKCNLSLDQLATLGLQLGADVPIFIHGHSAFAEGVGEQLQNVVVAEPWYVVLHPQVHVSTESVFGHPLLPRNTAKRSWQQLVNSDWQNDCQEIVAKVYPEVAQALSWLLEYAPSRMTGTGSCVFAAFDTEREALSVLEKRPKNVSGFVCKACNQSPLHEQLKNEKTLENTAGA
ncbi:4-diphosphocytidyl-2-C-methyl-D-erythritol kinase [Agarivorans sp. Toyoura001]|uniref:4-(cytidine 5'-diphospho)-2-C-methyl-D-erythritol kinase n=1 Tax=Agarivorans sp. Toyoura001 TaxID=2283141 RepID=UPI0010D7B6F4|nr:4-(cytidine 5'-diphospho)-2-C-methyl-D-erythritol kinase [Agarivorans sp. Toyoura001]GDY24330.1 4-diphosphocytidyl-2-C-methyl-D-erythritol kinase [Agarivorans sp. Toyoura001]